MAQLPTCTCNPISVDGYDFSPFWGQYFGECIYTPIQNASVICGLVSILLYGIALVPQFVKNYQRKSVQGLSFGLFVTWLIGDISNTLGAFLTQQFTTQKFTGVYFIVSEILIILQYIYYNNVYKPARRRSESSSLLGQSVAVLACLPFLVLAQFTSQQEQSVVVQVPICDAVPYIEPSIIMIGNALSWFGGIFYFVSRFPQIYINYKQKSIAGLSLNLIGITLIANVFYGISILLRVQEIELEKFLASTLPFVIGSIGTCVSDLVVFVQAYLYWDNNQEEDEILIDESCPSSPKIG